MKTYELEKTVWTEKEFATLGWHDSKVWGFWANTEEYEFSIDLDYLFKWVEPAEEDTYYKFWVAPVTMVFENAHSIEFDILSQLGEIEVANLHMENERKTPNGKLDQFDFRFECQEGEIKISATGFKLYARKQPILQQSQSLCFAQRGGIDFGRELSD
jgi:hypothetical protein